MAHQFKEDFADLLEVQKDALNDDYVLVDSEMWDSMTIVSTIALIDEHFGTTVEGEALAQCKTYGEVKSLAAAD